jgi:molybdate transport system substrate-binding protein
MLAWLCAAVLCLAQPAAPPAITVSAAASLTDALEEIARAYRAAGGGPVRFNFAGSNVLARQIAAGAPVDLFVSADEAQMEVAQAAGAINPSTRVDLLGNRLAIVSRPGMVLAGARSLIEPAVRRIAIGDPRAVPAGVYARRYLEAVGLWAALEPKLVAVGNVRAALVAVENGSADAAIVYESDVATARAVTGAVVTDPAAPRIVYPAAIVRASRNPAEAQRFLTFLQSAEASRVFRSWKFVPLAGAAR